MKSLIIILFASLLMLNCREIPEKNTEELATIEVPDNSSILGIWKRMSPQGPMSIHFKKDGVLEIDLGDDNSMDVLSNYEVVNDTITFYDHEGKTCPNSGTYRFYNRGFTIAFDVLDDLCNGRVKSTSGFWVRSNHQEQLSELSAAIKSSNDSSLVLHRGRMYLALGRSKLAKKDFDSYIKTDTTNAKVFVHRAATRFPMGLTGIVSDCTKAIALDPNEKYAYFLRGIAYYGLEEKQKGCDDFQKAIDLGFEILKEAEYDKCRNYW